MLHPKNRCGTKAPANLIRAPRKCPENPLKLTKASILKKKRSLEMPKGAPRHVDDAGDSAVHGEPALHRRAVVAVDVPADERVALAEADLTGSS